MSTATARTCTACHGRRTRVHGNALVSGPCQDCGGTGNTDARDAAEALAAASPRALLTAYASLTHRIHEAERTPCDEAVEAFLTIRDRIAALRTERGLVEDEILRRMGADGPKDVTCPTCGAAATEDCVHGAVAGDQGVRGGRIKP